MTSTDEWLRIESLDLEAQGVAHNAEGKVVFVEDALAGEEVQVAVRQRKNNWERAALVALRRPSAQRVVPRCPHFGVCGGCALQHLHVGAQVATKQRALEDALWHLGKVRPERILRPIEGPAWGYRQRARLSVRHVAKKGGVLVGFHERRSSYVADIRSCDVLPPHVSRLLLPLRELIGAMRARDRLPQIELAVGDTTTALVLRHLEPLAEEDLERLRRSPRSTASNGGCSPRAPTRRGRSTALRRSWPIPCPSSASACLSGRPTSPRSIATSTGCWSRARCACSRRSRASGSSTGSAASATSPCRWRPGRRRCWVSRAARRCSSGPATRPASTGLAERARFEAANLFEVTPESLARTGPAERWLIDPPREGAFAIAKALADLAEQPVAGWTPPRRIVYVSCNPATLARDAGLIVHRAGYRCTAAGAVNVFPRTTHVESLAVFDRL